MEIKNLSKEYQIKDGLPVLALKGVSFKLPEKGMIFLLGRSGSGKTTLLNLLSALDKPSGGQILFRGKDLSKMSPSETSDYRNTYCGYIFQEYNVLPELTVGENIALALEMQGESNRNGFIETILKDVELEGYAMRKVDELSGGQRQRVAIARAIAKNPDIIFADEPTGALDSVAGDAIFSFLKKISKEKLVIVVTHDREFAQKFGERIIELSDGKIISDSEKMECEELQSKSYKAVKAKISFKTAAKISGRNLSRHPIRLVVTLFLTILSFVMFGIPMDIMMWDSNHAFIDAVYEYDVKISQISKNGKRHYDGSIFDRLIGADSYFYELDPLTEEEYDLIQAQTTTPLVRARDCDIYSFQKQMANLKDSSSKAEFDKLLNGEDDYALSSSGYLYVDEVAAKFFGYQIIGRLPQNSDEVALSECLYNTFAFFGFQEEGAFYEIKRPEDFLGHKIYVNDIGSTESVKTIVGIVDTHCTKECGSKGEFEHFFHEKLFFDRSSLSLSTKKGPVGKVYWITPKQKAEFTDMFHFITKFRDGESTLSIYNDVSSILLESDHGTVAYLRNLAFLLSAVFFVIGFVFLLNFVKISMRQQRKQLGILTAMGINTKGLIKIYSVITIFICGITFILSSLSVFGLGFLINHYFNFELNRSTIVKVKVIYKICQFHFLVPIIMLATLFIVAFLGCILPILCEKKKYSVEIINSGAIQ